MLLELARHAPFDGVVARVVGPGRDLVEEQGAVGQQEHLDAKDAGAVERGDGGRGRGRGGLAGRGRRRGGGLGHPADRVPVHRLARPGKGSTSPLRERATITASSFTKGAHFSA